MKPTREVSARHAVGDLSHLKLLNLYLWCSFMASSVLMGVSVFLPAVPTLSFFGGTLLLMAILGMAFYGGIVSFLRILFPGPCSRLQFSMQFLLSTTPPLICGALLVSPFLPGIMEAVR